MFCFRLQVTRGPHSDAAHRYCWQDHPASPSSLSSVRLLSIGRKKRCWLRLSKDLEVSSFHAELRFLGDGDGGMRLVLRDVKSTNGTKLNGEPLRPQQDYQLSSGDLIGVGRTSLRFVKVKHTQPCGDEEEASASAASCAAILTSSDSSPLAPAAAAPKVIVLDEDSAEEREAPALSAAASAGPKAVVIGSGDTPTDQPDTEPAQDEVQKLVVVVHKSGKDGVGADKSKEKEGGDGGVLGLVQKAKAVVKKGGDRTGGMNEFTPEEARCTVCSVMIGTLDMLEQQAHLNECLGGRVAAKSSDAVVPAALSTTVAKDAKPKSRKRGNAGDGTARAKKPRKPKASEAGGDSAPKATKPRKRKRAGDGEDIELALALAPTSKLSKEQQTDMQLAATKKKLAELDVQIAKLAKRRVNFVKTLSRLERTKEKLRKSQVLPPAKVQKFLDLTAALTVIFPSTRQAHADQRESMEDERNVSFVAKRYTPSRWIESEIAIDCEDEKEAELATVAAISMWARASQQLFGLQRDTLLYRNSVLRAFLDDDVDINSIEMVSTDDMSNEDADVVRGVESEAEAVLPPVASDATANQQSDWTPGVEDVEEVPAVVKRVFPNWQQDLAFLHDQTAEELEMALEAMNEAVKQVDDAEVGDTKSYHATANEESIAGEPSVAPSKRSPSIRGDQQRACEYMAQIMMRLIDEKRRPTASLDNGLPVIDLAASSNKNDQAKELHVSNKEAEEKLYNPEELPKAELIVDPV